MRLMGRINARTTHLSKLGHLIVVPLFHSFYFFEMKLLSSNHQKIFFASLEFLAKESSIVQL